jgi:hypothetical protein
MTLDDRRLAGTVVLAVALLGSPVVSGNPSQHNPAERARSDIVTVVDDAHAVLWSEPADLERRDLFYGPGGRAHQPHGTFTFVKEDLDGSHPKFELRDADGVQWKAKLGTEARPETVASRLVWAAGYAAEEEYFVDEIRVNEMPAHVHRGQRMIDSNGTMHGVRLKRESGEREKIGEWAWRQNPFTGTRELNGLRVLMAVINNWDLKDINNTVFEVKDAQERGAHERVYEVSDLGSSFGSTGLERTDHSNGDLGTYRRTAFITHLTSDEVEFEVPRRPDWIVMANGPEYFRRTQLLWLGRHIPRADAKWVGILLSNISPDQIRDAFRAAGYPPDAVAGFAEILKSRITQLRDL